MMSGGPNKPIPTEKKLRRTRLAQRSSISCKRHPLTVALEGGDSSQNAEGREGKNLLLLTANYSENPEPKASLVGKETLYNLGGTLEGGRYDKGGESGWP